MVGRGAVVLGYVALGALSLAGCSTADLIAQGRLAGPPSTALHRLNFRRPVLLLSSPRRSMPMTWGLCTRTFCCRRGRTHGRPERGGGLLHGWPTPGDRDCLTQLIAQLACTAYWFNPLAWLTWRQMQAERERACDDLVLSRRHPSVGLRRAVASHRRGDAVDPLRRRRDRHGPAQQNWKVDCWRSLMPGRFNRRAMTRGAVVSPCCCSEPSPCPWPWSGQRIPTNRVKGRARNAGPARPKGVGRPLRGLARLRDAEKGRIVWRLHDDRNWGRPDQKPFVRRRAEEPGRLRRQHHRLDDGRDRPGGKGRLGGFGPVGPRSLPPPAKRLGFNGHALRALRQREHRPIGPQLVAADRALKHGRSQSDVTDKGEPRRGPGGLPKPSRTRRRYGSVVKVACTHPGRAGSDRGRLAAVEALKELDNRAVNDRIVQLWRDSGDPQKAEVRWAAEHLGVELPAAGEEPGHSTFRRRGDGKARRRLAPFRSDDPATRHARAGVTRLTDKERVQLTPFAGTR